MTPDDLYALDLEDFVAERDRLVRALRKTDREGAAEVARLRKPTVAAWAVNVVARQHPKQVAALRTAGERLRAAQHKALRGDAGALRAASEQRRAAVATVADLVADVLGDRASAQASVVTATLEAATVDPEVGELVQAGRLDKERSAAAAGFGFGDVGDWTPPPPRARPAKQAAKRAEPPAGKPAAEPKPASAKRAKLAEPAEPAKAAKAAKAAKVTKPVSTQAGDRPAKRLAEATATAKQRAAELHDAELRVRDLKKQLTEATTVLRLARTRAQRAELDVEQLRQKAWEDGERGRRR